MDWFPAVMTLVGVLIGVGIQEFRIWRERKEKYMDMVFEKRLEIHQGAYYRCMRLSNIMLPHKLVGVEGLQAAVKELMEAIEWLNMNALYLDEASTAKMNSFLLYLGVTGSKYVYLDKTKIKDINLEEETRKILQNRNEVVSKIKKGIGVKYLPEREIPSVDIEEEKSFDEVVKKMAELMRKRMK